MNLNSTTKYDFNDDATEVDDALSFSQLVTFERCPLLYRCIHIEGLEPDFVPTVMLLLRAIRRAIGAYNRARMAGNVPDLDVLTGVFDEAWDADAQRARSPRGLSLDVARSHGHAVIGALYENPHHAGQVVAVEREFRVNISPDLPPVIGRIDLVERDENGRLVITDYKAVPKLERRSSDQLFLYRTALAAAGVDGAETARIRDVQVTLGPEPEVEDFYYRPGSDALRRLTDRLGAMVHRIQDSGFPGASTPRICAGCRFFERCFRTAQERVRFLEPEVARFMPYHFEVYE